MLTPPDLPPETIRVTVRDVYGLRATRVTFLPIGADVNSAVYRIETDDTSPYFLKLRRTDFDEVAVTVPAFLHAQGIRGVMAPLPAADGRLWETAHGYYWILYPYFAGHNGFERPLSDSQWVTLGRSVKAIHSAALPPELAARVPREDYSPRWRDLVLEFDGLVETDALADPTARDFAAFWRTKGDEIRTMVERAAQLASMMQAQPRVFVLCHFDLHAGNVLLGEGDELAIVDWDNPLLAPKERDLMFVGGGIGGIWNTAREEALFHQGYGPTRIDLVALSYYRYERIVDDLAAYGVQIFGAQGGVEDRKWGLSQVIEGFGRDSVVEIAHRTYSQLA